MYRNTPSKQCSYGNFHVVTNTTWNWEELIMDAQVKAWYYSFSYTAIIQGFWLRAVLGCYFKSTAKTCSVSKTLHSQSVRTHGDNKKIANYVPLHIVTSRLAARPRLAESRGACSGLWVLPKVSQYNKHKNKQKQTKKNNQINQQITIMCNKNPNKQRTENSAALDFISTWFKCVHHFFYK